MDKSQSIYEMQNDPRLLSLFKAQRETYSRAKWVKFIKFVISVIITVVLSYFTAQYSAESLSAFSVIYALIAIFALNFLDSLAGNTQKLGAMIQQLIDINLYAMPDMPGTLSETEATELIAKYINDDKSDFLNWYSDYSELPFSQQVFRCQQENVRWDSDIRKKYLVFIRIVGVLLTITLVLYAVCTNITTFQLCAILALTMPLIQYFFEETKSLKNNIENLNEIKFAMESIENNLRKADSATVNVELQRLQHLIFEHRKNGVVITNWVYKCFRKSRQALEDEIAKNTLAK